MSYQGMHPGTVTPDRNHQTRDMCYLFLFKDIAWKQAIRPTESILVPCYRHFLIGSLQTRGNLQRPIHLQVCGVQEETRALGEKYARPQGERVDCMNGTRGQDRIQVSGAMRQRLDHLHHCADIFLKAKTVWQVERILQHQRCQAAGHSSAWPFARLSTCGTD